MDITGYHQSLSDITFIQPTNFHHLCLCCCSTIKVKLFPVHHWTFYRPTLRCVSLDASVILGKYTENRFNYPLAPCSHPNIDVGMMFHSGHGVTTNNYLGNIYWSEQNHFNEHCYQALMWAIHSWGQLRSFNSQLGEFSGLNMVLTKTRSKIDTNI